MQMGILRLLYDVSFSSEYRFTTTDPAVLRNGLPEDPESMVQLKPTYQVRVSISFPAVESTLVPKIHAFLAIVQQSGFQQLRFMLMYCSLWRG